MEIGDDTLHRFVEVPERVPVNYRARETSPRCLHDGLIRRSAGHVKLHALHGHLPTTQPVSARSAILCPPRRFAAPKPTRHGIAADTARANRRTVRGHRPIVLSVATEIHMSCG
jgi:hypothetical protein